MTNLLNEEIMAIKHTIAHMKMALPFELDYGRKKKMENDIRDLNQLLEEKLNKCGDFKG